jgi:hypothetical protein
MRAVVMGLLIGGALAGSPASATPATPAPAAPPSAEPRVMLVLQGMSAVDVAAYIAARTHVPWAVEGAATVSVDSGGGVSPGGAVALAVAAMDAAGCTTQQPDGGWRTTCPATSRPAWCLAWPAGAGAPAIPKGAKPSPLGDGRVAVCTNDAATAAAWREAARG